MAKIYYRLVKNGTWKLEDVPDLWRSDVEELLRQDSLV